jgi:transcriptional regulator with XRE-family HTH domain
MRASVPLPVKRALIKLGDDIRTARLRRRISTAIMAERVMITRTTLRKLECGDPGVSFGAYATALFVLGLVSRVADLADIRGDDVGLQLADEGLPRRIRSAQKTRKLPRYTEVLGER